MADREFEEFQDAINEAFAIVATFASENAGLFTCAELRMLLFNEARLTHIESHGAVHFLQEVKALQADLQRRKELLRAKPSQG